jgi:hypothetical protein
VRAENAIRGCEQQSCGVSGPAVLITGHVPAVVFLLITRVITWLWLSGREETWKTAEILLLRHQVTVLKRHQACRPKPELGGSGPARDPVRRHTDLCGAGFRELTQTARGWTRSAGG